MVARATPAHGGGGLEANVDDLARGLARLGAEVEVLTTPPAHDFGPGVRIGMLAAPPGRYSGAWWRRTAAVARTGLGAFEVVLGVSASANAMAAARWRPGPAFVFQAHGTSLGEITSKLRTGSPWAALAAGRNAYWGLARDRAYRNYDAIAAVGAPVMRDLHAWPTRALVGRTPVVLVRNGVDPQIFRFDPAARARMRARLALPAEARVILFLGRLHSQKGAQLALAAFQQAAPRATNLHLLMVGDGPRRDALVRAAVALGMADRLHLPGPVPRDEVPGVLSAADVLLGPSRRAEGQPLVVLEALASGLPVVTTRDGAADEALPCHVVPRDDTAAMACAILAARPRAARASTLPTAFTVEAMAAGYLALFDDLCRRRRDGTDG